jgi:hypothetical protein
MPLWAPLGIVRVEGCILALVDFVAIAVGSTALTGVCRAAVSMHKNQLGYRLKRHILAANLPPDKLGLWLRLESSAHRAGPPIAPARQALSMPRGPAPPPIRADEPGQSEDSIG